MVASDTDFVCAFGKHWKTPQNRAKNLMKLDVPKMGSI